MDLCAQDFLHGFSAGELIDEFVEPAYFLHQRVFDGLYTDAAHEARNFRHVGVQGRRVEEFRERGARLQVMLQGGVIEAGQPQNNLIHLFLRAPFPLRLGDV